MSPREVSAGRRDAPVHRSRAQSVVRLAELTEADTLIELGSGTSEKTRVLLDALAEGGTLERYVPFDVDESVLQQAGRAVARSIPGASTPSPGDFEHHLPCCPRGGRRLIAFLGGTIGNLMPVERVAFVHTLGLHDGSRAMPCCWGPTWSRTRRGWSPPTTTSPA